MIQSPQTVFTAVTLTGQCRGWTRLESARELTVGETRSTKPDFVRFTAGLQKITAAFRLSRKTSKTYFFGLKNSHLTKFTDYGKKH